MIRKRLVGKVYGIEFIHDTEIQDDDSMLVLDAKLVRDRSNARFGEPVPADVMTSAWLATMSGKNYKRNCDRVSGSNISMRLVEVSRKRAKK